MPGVCLECLERLELPDVTDLWVAVDTEGGPDLHPDDGHRVSTISVAFEDGGELVVRAWPFDQGIRDKIPNQTLSLFASDDPNLGQDEWNTLSGWLERQRLIMHNASHDLAAIRAGTREWPGPNLVQQLGWDTLLGSWVLDPLESKGLDAVADRVLGRRKDDSELQKALRSLPVGCRKRYDMVRWEAIEQYARVDAELTYEIWRTQQERFEQDPQLWEVFQREMQLCRVIAGMVERGMGYDVEQSLVEAAKAERLSRNIASKLPFRATPNGARQWFYEQLGQIPHCVTSKGQPSVGECCLRVLVNANVAGAADYYRYGKVKHAVDKYYRGFPDKCGLDGRLRTDLRQTGTVSLRFSSQRINLQSLPHDYRLELVEDCAPVRSLLRAKPGHVLAEMDAAQAELRVGAKLARCHKMLRAFQAGDDIHAITAHELFQVDYDDPRFFEYRQVAKRSNFSLIYDVGPETFRATVERFLGIVLSSAESERIVYGWRSLYPEFPFINRKAELRARKRGYVILKSGRKRWFGPTEDLHKAFNQAVQGNIAEGFKLWMIELDAQWPDTLIMQVHDSIMVEVPEDEAELIVAQMCKQGEKLLSDLYRVPMVMDSKIL